MVDPPWDLLVYALLIVISAPGVFLVPHCGFWFDDVAYLQRGLSLLQSHFYGLAGTPEHVQPPGFPLFLALVYALAGKARHVLQSATAILGALGLLATYALLRREEGRRTAAAVTVLLGSSLHFFRASTRILSPTFAYILCAAVALLAVRRAETSAGSRSRTGWAALATVSLVAALLIHSTAIALLGALVAWLGASLLMRRPCAYRRLATFLPVLVVGIAVQGWWIRQAPATFDWPLPGYPASYLSQLELKRGNYPELGAASPVDLVVRVAENLHDQAAMLTEVISHRAIGVPWSSPAITGMAFLVVLGLGFSFLRTGGRLLDWYFVSFEAIYLLWSWSFEDRFFLPAVAFAAVYAWRGADGARRLAAWRPRLFGATALLVSIPLALHGAQWAARLDGRAGSLGALIAHLSVALWIAIAAAGVWLLAIGRLPSPRLLDPYGWLRATRPTLAPAAVTLLVLIGLGQQAAQGLGNVRLVVDDAIRPDVAGARWLDAHARPEALVLARQVPIVSYYSHRKTEWFPPISRPAILFEGILQRNADYVLVVDRDDSYFLPDDMACFGPLLQSHPDRFRLAAVGVRYFIYQVVR